MPAYRAGMSKEETKTVFHGKQQRDYQGRSWIEPPRGVRPDPDHECFVPKKCLHTYTGHTKAVQVRDRCGSAGSTRSVSVLLLPVRWLTAARCAGGAYHFCRSSSCFRSTATSSCLAVRTQRSRSGTSTTSGSASAHTWVTPAASRTWSSRRTASSSCRAPLIVERSCGTQRPVLA